MTLGLAPPASEGIRHRDSVKQKKEYTRLENLSVKPRALPITSASRKLLLKGWHLPNSCTLPNPSSQELPQVPVWLVSTTLPTALLCRWPHPALAVAVPAPQHLDLTEMQVRYWAKNSPKQSVPICCCSSHLNLFHREIERVMSHVLAISPSPPYPCEIQDLKKGCIGKRSSQEFLSSPGHSSPSQKGFTKEDSHQASSLMA